MSVNRNHPDFPAYERAFQGLRDECANEEKAHENELLTQYPDGRYPQDDAKQSEIRRKFANGLNALRAEYAQIFE